MDDAREIGVPYDLEGRLRDPDDGLDCKGSVFFERVGPCQPVIAGLGALVVDDGWARSLAPPTPPPVVAGHHGRPTPLGA
ncbi:MAG: hypothetical protein IPG45_25525 [Deltaproteobacteria bacterium]|nr:hypothetical protein [Deltaproteobacteria bacterium]